VKIRMGGPYRAFRGYSSRPRGKPAGLDSPTYNLPGLRHIKDDASGQQR
jgi:hypothetical protein